MPDLLTALLIGLPLLVVALPVLRWAARADRRAGEREALDRVYYPRRGLKAGTPPFRRRRAVERRRTAYGRRHEWLIDLDVDEREDDT